MEEAVNERAAGVDVERISEVLRTLPPEKVAEVWDFVLFLERRYGGTHQVDASDSWSDEDIRDLTVASLTYADDTVWGTGDD